MKTAIIYASVHHGNTKKIIDEIAKSNEVDLIDATQVTEKDLSGYDLIGFASGVYYGKFHQSVDFYVMEASDEEFDTEEVRKLVKRLDELDPIPLPWKSDEEALKDFWEYCEERQREERIIADMKIKD